jgi:hypothetical protein
MVYRQRRLGAMAIVTPVPQSTQTLLQLPPQGGGPLPIGDNKQAAKKFFRKLLRSISRGWSKVTVVTPRDPGSLCGLPGHGGGSRRLAAHRGLLTGRVRTPVPQARHTPTLPRQGGGAHAPPPSQGGRAPRQQARGALLRPVPAGRCLLRMLAVRLAGAGRPRRGPVRRGRGGAQARAPAARRLSWGRDTAAVPERRCAQGQAVFPLRQTARN